MFFPLDNDRIYIFFILSKFLCLKYLKKYKILLFSYTNLQIIRNTGEKWLIIKKTAKKEEKHSSSPSISDIV